MDKKLTVKEHKKRHIELHHKLDELMADYINHTRRGLRETNLIEFMEWSYQQTIHPSEENQGRDSEEAQNG